MLTQKELELLDELVWGRWPWRHTIHTEEDIIRYFNKYPNALENLRKLISEELMNKVMLLTIINN